MTETAGAIYGVLEGIRWLRDPLKLTDAYQLRQPSSKERFFLEDLIRGNQKSGRFLDIQPFDRESCILESALPTGAALDAQRVTDSLAPFIQEYLLHPLTLLRLFKPGLLGIRCVLVRLEGPQDRYVIRETPYLRPAAREFGRGNYELEAGEAEQLQSWMRLNWLYGLAQRPEVRWFNRAYHEPDTGDQVQSLVMALEYILFRDDPDRANLRYKFPMRGAWLLGNDYAARRDIFRDLRRVFDLQGTILNSTKTGAFDRNDQLLLERTEEYLRRLIALLLSRGGTTQIPMDEHILAGKGPTERLPVRPALEVGDRQERPQHHSERRLRRGRHHPPRQR
jgi:hypothetical protein